jgi:hypothetical protein
VQEAGLVERAEPLEHGHRDREGEHVARELVAHRDVGRADHGLRSLEVVERGDELPATGAEGRGDRRGIAPGVVVVGADLKHAQLVGVHPEGDAAQVPEEVALERPDEDVPVLRTIDGGVVEPARHELT